MKILLIGDPHFKVDNKIETEQLIEKTLEYVKENKEDISFIVVLGDTLDTHEKIHIQPLCRANYFITELSKLLFTFVLIGNHDRMNNKDFLSDKHPFTALKGHKNIKIVDQVFKFKKFIFVPYVDKGRFLEALRTIDFSPEMECKAIFAHQEFKGAAMRNIVSENGDEWSDNYPPVFSGHIHSYQKVKENIYYIGTPYQQNFYESEDKALALLSIDEDKFNLERVKLDIIKKKIIHLKAEELDNFEIPENYLIKLIIEGNNKVIQKLLQKDKIKSIIDNPRINFKLKNIFEQKDSPTIAPDKRSFNKLLTDNIENLNDYEKGIFHSISSLS